MTAWKKGSTARKALGTGSLSRTKLRRAGGGIWRAQRAGAEPPPLRGGWGWLRKSSRSLDICKAKEKFSTCIRKKMRFECAHQSAITFRLHLWCARTGGAPNATARASLPMPLSRVMQAKRTERAPPMLCLMER